MMQPADHGKLQATLCCSAWVQHLVFRTVLRGSAHPASGVRCSPGRGRLLAASMDGSVALLDARGGELLQAVRAHTKYCVRVRWLPEGAGFITAGREGALACWACATGAPAGPPAAAPDVWLI